MKKLIIMLISALAFVLVLTGCDKADTNIVFSGTVEEVTDTAILVFTGDDVGFDKARVAINDQTKIDFTLAVGQTVRVTILPEIAESYPVQVKAVEIELISEPSPEPSPSVTPSTSPTATPVVAYTAAFYRADSYTDGGFDFIADRAANADTLFISSVHYIPVVSITSEPALAQFVDDGAAYFQFDVAYGESGSFSDAVAAYDETYFTDKQLLILYTVEPSGSIRHEIVSVTVDGETLMVSVHRLIPEEGTADMANWFIIIELPTDALDGVTSFNAYMEN